MTEPKEDDVLVPKFGKEKEFYEAMHQMHKIGTGKLGRKGHAELMVDLGLTDAILEEELKGTREEKVEQYMEVLQQSHLQTLYEYGEWVSKEVAEKRTNARKVLYGKEQKTD